MRKLLFVAVLGTALPQLLNAQGIAGAWSGTLTTPGAQVPLEMSFKVKGDTVSGTVKRSSGDVALTGRVKGDSVSFQYTIEYGGNPFTMNLRGRVKGDSLTGIVDFGGGNQEAFAARRVPASKADPARGG